ncbi:uncharacterized protein EDB91DRAFT_1251557 [Suillus paluster]|uniref:uncharacterized protein n=1 Tax=Suillus paluster TaxID=48578 RepID=UPI001B85CDFF|nr:uncharacterized protein EDB91DRAFT_1251557 [Suillus paluster]KAG1733067.1 hypothetical protein EDB91DRAFT_1251557 [Suillus paluster]
MMLQLMFFKDCTSKTSDGSTAHTSIHKGDITHFAQAGFKAWVQLLAIQQGFQADVIRTVYGYLKSYEQTVETIEVMREVAEERAVAEILSKTEEDEDEDSVKDEEE